MSTLPIKQAINMPPMTVAGSARRFWGLTRLGRPWALPATVLAALAVTAAWWAVIAVWHGVILTFALWLFPERGRQEPVR